jgi:DNA polymerase V
MGIGMGVPWFKVKDSFLSQGGQVFSSNFTFYGDMSARVMNILEGFVPEVEIYSIDEAFLGLDSLEEHYNLYDFGCHIRSLVKQWTGVPVRIGIAPTKTLTKIALNEAKRLNVPRFIKYLPQKKSEKPSSILQSMTFGVLAEDSQSILIKPR